MGNVESHGGRDYSLLAMTIVWSGLNVENKAILCADAISLNVKWKGLRSERKTLVNAHKGNVTGKFAKNDKGCCVHDAMYIVQDTFTIDRYEWTCRSVSWRHFKQK